VRSNEEKFKATRTVPIAFSSSESQIAGADMAKTIMDLKTQQIKQQVQIYTQKSMEDQAGNTLNLLR